MDKIDVFIILSVLCLSSMIQWSIVDVDDRLSIPRWSIVDTSMVKLIKSLKHRPSISTIDHRHRRSIIKSSTIGIIPIVYIYPVRVCTAYVVYLYVYMCIYIYPVRVCAAGLSVWFVRMYIYTSLHKKDF